MRKVQVTNHDTFLNDEGQPAGDTPEYQTWLAERLLEFWKQAHSSPTAQANILTGEDSFAILIENAFNQAEIMLVQKPEGEALLQRYIQKLMDQVYPKFIQSAEQNFRRTITAVDTAYHFKANRMLCYFKLDHSHPSTAS